MFIDYDKGVLKTASQELSILVHTCDPNTQEAEAEGLRVRGQLGYIVRPYLKEQYKQTNKNTGV
jgi:hypothetical protein